ncbi:MAG: DUF1269 domain-containing protein [Firmicutes bacterium]|nr:DUF1269 domain-containing protein [Bacillota bacterium]
MINSVIVVSFAVESEAYQALSELKREAVCEDYVISQACVVKKEEEGKFKLQDSFDTGVETRNDTRRGGLLGALIGILGGPMGVLLGYGAGTLLGLAVDSSDAARNLSYVGQVSDSLPEGGTGLIALVAEQDTVSFDVHFVKYEVQLTRLDAAEVAAEVEKTLELQKQLEKEARAKMREEKKEARRQKVEQHRAKLEADFEEFKQDFQRRGGGAGGNGGDGE